MEKNNRTVEDIMKNEGIELWGLCGFSEVRPLLDCRAASRIPTNAQTVLFFAFPYRKEEAMKEGRNLSLYACVEDYHTVCTARLSLLCERLKETFPTSSFEAFVDNSPIREVYGAAKAGLGKIGRNGLLITKKYGSYVFIGEIVTDLKLAVAASEVECCEGCDRCVAECPSGALSHAGLDRSRCLSHISQKKGELTPEESELLRKGGLVWGCDHCQQVCPLNAGCAFAGEELFENVDIRADIGEPEAFFRTRAYSFRGKAPIERNIRLLEEDEKRQGERMTILEFAEEYKEADCARFHTPGHKGNFEPLNRLALSGLDITELVGMGSLYEGNGPIAQTEQLFEQLYGSRKTLLSAGGCTLCIQAMLAVSNLSGKRLLAGRNSHVSLFHTAALLDIELLFTEAFGGAPSAESVRSALSQDSEIAAVYLTSVGYLGEQADVAGISAVCREYGVPLLVDNAHGAHLKWMEGQIHPLDAGASLCCDSIHKSLPAMTGAALLHIGEERFVERAREKMALFGSTSPSYPVLISAQLCAEYLLSGECGEDFLRLSHRMEKIRNIARKKRILYEEGTEPTKLTIKTFGENPYAHFKRYSVEPEYFSEEYMVFWASPMNSNRDFDRLEEAIQGLPSAACRKEPPLSRLSIPRQVLSIRQVTFANSEEIGIDSAVGRVAGDTVSACPPGWVFAVPGEQMTEETVRRIKAQGIQTVRVVKDSQTAFDR